MKPDIKHLWLNRLHNTPKTNLFLKDKIGYCALGILLEIVSELSPYKGYWLAEEDYFSWKGRNVYTPPTTVLTWAMLRHEDTLNIIQLNEYTERFDSPGGIISYIQRIKKR